MLQRNGSALPANLEMSDTHKAILQESMLATIGLQGKSYPAAIIMER